MSNVTCMLEWPIWSQTYFALSPWAINIDAKKWRLCRQRHNRQHADFLIMPTWYSKLSLAAPETHWESA